MGTVSENKPRQNHSDPDAKQNKTHEGGSMMYDDTFYIAIYQIL